MSKIRMTRLSKLILRGENKIKVAAEPKSETYGMTGVTYKRK